MFMMAENFVDLVVTSPPYDGLRKYNGFSFDVVTVIKALWRVMKEGGVVVWVVGDQVKDFDESGTSFKQALYFKEVGFKLFDTMIYAKPPRGMKLPTYIPAFEYMFVFSKGKPKTINLIKDRQNKTSGIERIGRPFRNQDGKTDTYKRKLKVTSKYGVRTNIWKYYTGLNQTTADEYAFAHPAMFPEKLAQDHIISWSNEGDLVYDPFVGSGTTTKMAKILGRNYIGTDISREYCEIARKRLAQQQLFKGQGK